MPQCLDEQTAIDLTDERLPAQRAAEVRAHIAVCDACFELVAASLEADAEGEGAGSGTATAFPGSPALLSQLEPGTLVAGKYRVQARIGEGATGVVYRAVPATGPDEGPVAIKIYNSAAIGDETGRNRALRELEIGRTLRDDHVCPVLDTGWVEARPYLVLALAERSLREELQRSWSQRTLGGRLADALAVTRGVASAHAAGLVHRDLKPENVLRLPGDRLVISDFGLARTAVPTDRERTIGVGTPIYMAPELADAPATQASDIYALGVVVYEIVFAQTRVSPFLSLFLGGRRWGDRGAQAAVLVLAPTAAGAGVVATDCRRLMAHGEALGREQLEHVRDVLGFVRLDADDHVPVVLAAEVG